MRITQQTRDRNNLEGCQKEPDRSSQGKTREIPRQIKKKGPLHRLERGNLEKQGNPGEDLESRQRCLAGVCLHDVREHYQTKFLNEGLRDWTVLTASGSTPSMEAP